MRASISRTELFAFVRQLGGNPHDTRRVEIAPDGIKVTTFRRDEQGRLVAAGDDAATEVTTIAIVGNDGDRDTVRMRHPNLDAEIDVPATAVGHHAVAGWEAVGNDAGPSFKPDSDGWEPVGDRGIRIGPTDDGRWVAADGGGYVPGTYATREEAIAAAESMQEYGQPTPPQTADKQQPEQPAPETKSETPRGRRKAKED